VGVQGSIGRAVAGLVGVVVAALLASGVPASADPTSTPSPSPTATKPTSGASGGATAGPSPSGTSTAKNKTDTKADDGKADDGKADAASAADDAHDSAALIAATQALQEAQANLVGARADLETARAELAAAKTAELAAQQDLDIAVQAEQRAIRDLAAVRARLAQHQTYLGRLARSAYQSNGVLGEWALVLDAETPHQLADRLATLQSVASAGNAVIADLERDRADLTNSQARLSAARQAQEAARDQARAALLDKAAREKQATQAEHQVGVVVAARSAALAAAQQAATDDKVQYHTMLQQSGALAQRIIGLAGQLAKGKHAPHGTGHLTRPGRGVVTSTYGPRMHPILHYVKIHTGIDFAAADGISYAADDGVVLITEFNVAYGNMTVIDHGTVGGVHMTTLYAHQAAFGVQPGDRVVKGQPIGVIGETGYATGPHLHFEVRIDGAPVDPSPFLTAAPMPPLLNGSLRRPTSP
jgi:murein DD-endopeptidase MepM/ murein hydrolase activator NlpD